MSFRAFIFNCAVCGGWMAFLGWTLGRMLAGTQPIAAAGIKGMFLGMLVGLGLSLIDALWVYSLTGALAKYVQALPRVGLALVVGTVGGLIGGVVGQFFYGLTEVWLKQVSAIFFVLGWTITGFLIGASIGLFDLLYLFVRQEDAIGAMKKIAKGILGGTAGGVVGAILSLLLKSASELLFPNKPIEALWSPSAWGFVALGLSIGLMIGLAQVLLRETWVRVEEGFRPGRELILSQPIITIGRAESCDIGLFGDPTIERLHARILLQGNRYLLADESTPGGTFLNGERITAPAPLCADDLIRIGNSVLRFGERQKRQR